MKIQLCWFVAALIRAEECLNEGESSLLQTKTKYREGVSPLVTDGTEEICACGPGQYSGNPYGPCPTCPCEEMSACPPAEYRCPLRMCSPGETASRCESQVLDGPIRPGHGASPEEAPRVTVEVDDEDEDPIGDAWLQEKEDLEIEGNFLQEEEQKKPKPPCDEWLRGCKQRRERKGQSAEAADARCKKRMVNRPVCEDVAPAPPPLVLDGSMPPHEPMIPDGTMRPDLVRPDVPPDYVVMDGMPTDPMVQDGSYPVEPPERPEDYPVLDGSPLVLDGSPPPCVCNDCPPFWQTCSECPPVVCDPCPWTEECQCPPPVVGR